MICPVEMYWMCCESLGCPVVIEQPGSISHALHKGPVIKRVLTDVHSSGVTASQKVNVSKWASGYASGCLQMAFLEVVSATFSAASCCCYNHGEIRRVNSVFGFPSWSVEDTVGALLPVGAHVKSL